MWPKYEKANTACWVLGATLLQPQCSSSACHYWSVERRHMRDIYDTICISKIIHLLGKGSRQPIPWKKIVPFQEWRPYDKRQKKLETEDNQIILAAYVCNVTPSLCCSESWGEKKKACIYFYFSRAAFYMPLQIWQTYNFAFTCMKLSCKFHQGFKTKIGCSNSMRSNPHFH